MIWKLLGTLLLLKYGITLSQFLWMMTRLYLLPKFGMKKNLKKFGAWAVVTGATDGIGKAIAKQLAKRGINLVLISRSSDKLQSVCEEFQTYGVEIKTIVYDFSDINNYEKIAEELKDLEVGILVNNVGIGYDHPSFFLELTDDFCDKLINVDVISIPKMTKIVLEGMVARKRGLIVHVSSESALKPIPLLSLYSAAKSFVSFFSNALQHEYSRNGVFNQVLVPSFVATNMSKVRARGVMIPSADHFAASAVDAFGLAPTMAGYWAHELQSYLISIVPEAVFYKIVGNTMHAGRKRWLRKQEQKTD